MLFSLLKSSLPTVALVAGSFFLGNSWAEEPAASRNQAQQTPAHLRGVGIIEKLGTEIPLDRYSFKNEKGEIVPFKSFFGTGKPVLLSFAYYNCPTLCGVLLNGILDGLKGMDWLPGKQFHYVNVSIDPREGPELASDKKANFLQALGKPDAGAGWHFLTGEDSQIKALASDVGFGYRYDEKQQEYLHGAGVFILTPDGKISRILYGIQFLPTDLKLSLLEASNGKVGTILDRLLLFCYSYDPHLKKYSLTITRVMQAAALLTIILLVAFLSIFWSKQRETNETG